MCVELTKNACKNQGPVRNKNTGKRLCGINISSRTSATSPFIQLVVQSSLNTNVSDVLRDKSARVSCKIKTIYSGIFESEFAIFSSTILFKDTKTFPDEL